MERMRLEREKHRLWHVALCGECGAMQDSDYTETHFSGAHPCPNAGKFWVRKYVEVVPKDHWEEACQHIEALLDDGADITQAGFFTKQADKVRREASRYLSKFETIGVPASTATGGKSDA